MSKFDKFGQNMRFMTELGQKNVKNEIRNSHV